MANYPQFKRKVLLLVFPMATNLEMISTLYKNMKSVVTENGQSPVTGIRQDTVQRQLSPISPMTY